MTKKGGNTKSQTPEKNQSKAQVWDNDVSNEESRASEPAQKKRGRKREKWDIYQEKA